jgi:hypothetical protein
VPTSEVVQRRALRAVDERDVVLPTALRRVAHDDLDPVR